MLDDIDFGAALEPQSAPAPPTAPLIPEIVDEDENLPALPKFSTQEAATRVIQWEKEIAAMEAEARGITVIKDEGTNIQAATLGQQAKKLYKRLEDLRQYFVRPHLDYQQEVNAFFKRVTSRLKAIDESMGRLESAYARLLENERRRQEALARQAAQEEQERLAQEAAAAAAEGIEYEPVIVVPQVIPEAPKVTHTAEGSSSQRKKWNCTIIDPDKVPREYCTPDQKLLNDAVKRGVRAIEGCLIEEDSRTVRRV